MKARYALVDCCGTSLGECVDIYIPDGCDPTNIEFCFDAVQEAGYDPFESCDSCGDRSVRANFIEVVQ